MVPGIRLDDQSPPFLNRELRLLSPAAVREGLRLILEVAIENGCIDETIVFIDSTHVKAYANRKKYTKELAEKTARIYDEQLREEIDQERSKRQKPLKLKRNPKGYGNQIDN